MKDFINFIIHIIVIITFIYIILNAVLFNKYTFLNFIIGYLGLLIIYLIVIFNEGD